MDKIFYGTGIVAIIIIALGLSVWVYFLIASAIDSVREKRYNKAYKDATKDIGSRLYDAHYWFNQSENKRIAKAFELYGIDLMKYGRADISLIRDEVFKVNNQQNAASNDINPNGQYYPGKTTESSPMHDYEVYRPGIPIKLELAARFMAARMANPEYNLSIGGNLIAKEALDFADDLINEFNNQQKEAYK